MVITLLTDFGTRDTFVAEMKGVILSINPSVSIVDITHEIEPFNITEGAIKLSSAQKYFPQGTIHLAVVDPGVGSSRKGIIIKTDKAFFVGPDNGILSLAVKEHSVKEIYEITLPELSLQTVGPTFHGRDIFAPVAARLSKGESPESLGRRSDEFVSITLPEPVMDKERIIGEVIIIDRFGNAITNIPSRILGNRRFRVRIKSSGFLKNQEIFEDAGKDIPLFKFYKEAGDKVGALINSSGYIEIFKYQASAQKALNIKLYDKVEVLFE